jgi:hypothetical protein
MRRLTMTILAACCAVSISSAHSTSRNIDLKAADGQVLKATYFSPGAIRLEDVFGQRSRRCDFHEPPRIEG